MTEEDAKTRWCPFARKPSLTAGRVSEAVNRKRDGSPADHTTCIASACMAWRVQVQPPHQENLHNQSEPPEGEGWKPGSPAAANRWWWRTVPERVVGFCGLAGAPL